MELHQLRYAVAVARAGNFSRAAAQCRVAQPSLSQQIQKLEDELGGLLFERLPRGARLTPFGEAFLRRAQSILNEVEVLKREAGDARNLLTGSLAVGVLPTIAPYLLPSMVKSFAERFPGVEVIVHEDTTERLLRQAGRCEIDVAIASLPLDDDRMAVKPLFSEELLLALPADHPLTLRRTLKAADLDGQKLIVMKEGHCLGDQVLHFCDRSHACPNISIRSAQLETILALVQCGMGISLIPEMAVQQAKGAEPVFRSLTDPKPERRIVAFWPKSRPPGRAVEEFLAGLPAREKA